MDIEIGYLDLIKMGFKLAGHKFQQYRLKTNETKIIATTDGKLKGVKRITAYNDTYHSFEKIPFAKPPVGDLRFKAPEPCVPWEGVRDCYSPGKKPLQEHIIFGNVDGSEDCLYLNVYVKKLLSENPLPVMVCIYGGAFQVGEASRDVYSPDYFMREDIVLVMVSYRLGPFGFISFKDPSLNIPGNAALKDIVLALRWVKKNIQYFNGDANNITLFGESAGGVSTHYMMITDQTKGLFQKAIVQSGSVLASWATTPYSSYPYRLALAAGYKGEENEKKICEFLTKCNGKKIITAQKNLLTEEERRDRLIFIFGPVIEPYITAHCVVPKHPVEMLRTAWSNEIPLIIGGCSFEGLFSYAETIKSPGRINNLGDCQHIVPPELCPDRTTDLCKELGLKLKKAHFGDNQPSITHLYSYLDLMSYRLFWHAIHRALQSRLAYASAPTYLYRFDFDSAFFNHFRLLKCGKEVRGVCHGDDLSYLFYNIISVKLQHDSPEYKTMERMIAIWTHYAATGDPNTDRIQPVVWKPAEIDESPTKCLNISHDVKYIDLPESDKLKIWDSLYTKDLY
ncbi:esterase B1-like [Eupeodes corollae]|uniref:esterase B1-like n=1 Tax=Eupeodes corollae TaxID=290404 RepID=UPI0024916697|nr:esterase B1-like [Eupeodes corollae]